MANKYQIGVVGLGQLGTALALDLDGKAGQNVLGVDPYLSTERRQHLATHGIQIVEHSHELANLDYVLIAVPQSHSKDAVKMVADAVAPRTVIVDLTSADAISKQDVSQVAIKANRHYIDGAVVGPAADGIKVPIIVSGEQAPSVAHNLAKVGMNITAVGPDVGHASSIKIVRSVLAKGLEALYVEGLLAARRLGIQDAVFDTFCAMLDARSAKDLAELLVTTHTIHAQRRHNEVSMSRRTLESTGLPLHMTQAMLGVFADTIRGSQPLADQDLPGSLTEALETLDRYRQTMGNKHERT